MPFFLVEIPMNNAGRPELALAARTLDAGQARLRRRATAARTVIAGVTHEDGRLVCLVEAPSFDVVRSLVTLALLPAGRIREITRVDRPSHSDPAQG
jgi:hypothetical protein